MCELYTLLLIMMMMMHFPIFMARHNNFYQLFLLTAESVQRKLLATLAGEETEAQRDT